LVERGGDGGTSCTCCQLVSHWQNWRWCCWSVLVLSQVRTRTAFRATLSAFSPCPDPFAKLGSSMEKPWEKHFTNFILCQQFNFPFAMEFSVIIASDLFVMKK